MIRLRALLLGLLAIALVACNGDEPEASPTTAATPAASTATATTAPTEASTPEEAALSGEAIVSAASSLTDVFTEIGNVFMEMHDDVTIEFNFGSSSSLATQIVEGAPADVFASANNAQMQVVVDAGDASNPQTFAQNRIVVVAPADDDTVQEFADIATDGVRLVLAGAEVPVGDYARQAIAAAEAEDPGFEEAALGNLVSEEANVRAVLTKIELSEAEAGVVYETDAAISGDAVRVVPIPTEYVAPAVYPIALVGDSPSEVAQAFMDFVLSADGQAILQKYGFSAP